MANKQGMFFHKSTATNIKEAAWWEEHCVRRQGGYDLDKSNLPDAFRWLPKGAILKFDKTTGKAVVVKTAEVAEDAATGATSIKVKHTGLLKVGDTFNGNKITAIASTDDVDTLTVAATSEEIKKGAVISDYDKDNDVLLGLAYETNDLRDNDNPFVTPTLEAVEIEKDTMPFPVNDDIIAGLNKPGYGKHLFRIQ